MRILIGVALIGLGLAGATWSASELSNGLRELPQHWWSTAAVAPALAGLALLLAEHFRRRTSSQPL